MKTMTMPEFQERLKTDKLAVIDVRPAERYQEGHVPGAVNIPFTQLDQAVTELDQQKTYYIICQLGFKSQEATAFLTEKGFSAINVDGGTAAFEGELER